MRIFLIAPKWLSLWLLLKKWHSEVGREGGSGGGRENEPHLDDREFVFTYQLQSQAPEKINSLSFNK